MNNIMDLQKDTSLAETIATEPGENVEKGLWGGDDVEGRWDGASLFEVGDPQLRPRKLPLCVRLLLRGRSIVHRWSGNKKG